jgi:hypothetical protein
LENSYSIDNCFESDINVACSGFIRDQLNVNNCLTTTVFDKIHGQANRLVHTSKQARPDEPVPLNKVKKSMM